MLSPFDLSTLQIDLLRYYFRGGYIACIFVALAMGTVDHVLFRASRGESRSFAPPGPRNRFDLARCSATNRLIPATEHGSCNINVGQARTASGCFGALEVHLIEY